MNKRPWKAEVKNIGQMNTMMRRLKYEGQLKELLQLQNSKENCEMIRKNQNKSERIEMRSATQRITKHC